MFTDVAGYTALGQKNEALSLALVETQRKLIRPILKKHDGREVKTVGDAFLVEFPSALDAVRCAYDIQRATREFNISLPEDRRLHLRIGLHLGDVTKSRGDIQGDAVNVASRIESLAEDGGVCLTRQVYDHVQNKFAVPLQSLGTKSLKNVGSPLEIYKMVLPWEEDDLKPVAQRDASRIAVLPFTNMSPDPSESYFADGMTEEIISTLSNVSGLNVISRTSTMGYKGTTKKLKEIGSELEAGSVLEGSFRKAGNKIRVTTQLIDVATDRNVWAHSYDSNLGDVFAVQSDIAKEVAEALRVRILAPEIERIDRRPTDSANAYTLYLRGRYHWNRRNIDDIRKAAEYFELAVEEDTKFALGYVGLADCHEILSTNYGIDININHERAKTELVKALELDEGAAEAHASRGLVLLSDFIFMEAESEFRRAIDLKPSYAPTHMWYFHLLLRELRWDEALFHIKKAVELDPFSQIINLNHARYYEARKDYHKAIDLYRKTSELDPNFFPVHVALFEVYGKIGRLNEAKREAKTAAGLMKKEHFPRESKVLAAMTAYFENDKERVRRLLPELEAHVGQSPEADAFRVASLYFYLGENDKGFEWLDRSYSRREFAIVYNKNDEFFDDVRTDPRYQNFLKRLWLKQAEE